MATLIFHSMAGSAYLWTAMMAADEKGVDHALNPVVFGSDEHLSLHPFAKMPVMQHGEVILYETQAITHYIDRAFDGPPLQPADALGQAEVLRWISLVNAYVFPVMNRFMKERLVRPAWGFEVDQDFVQSVRDPLRLQMRIIGEAVAKGSGDFVEECAAELPLQAIADLLGVPMEDRKKLFHWSNQMVGDQDPEFANNDAISASVELITYGMQMAAERSARPGDDLVTKLVQADVEGHKLSDDEFGFFVILLAVAGNETTRNSITQGMMAFTEFPDQWELFKRERPATTADEIVRWATPVTSFQRTALQDTELGGVPIKKGQRVVMFYRSANFDEEVFEDPFSFDILPDPNPHVGFGGTGAHYCIGANLARMTIDLMFNAIADAMPDLTPLEKPERLRSGWLNGIKHWQVDYAGSVR